GLTPTVLATGCNGSYYGVVLATGSLVYYNGSTYVSALSDLEWQNLWAYEANFSVRQVSWYTYPTPDFGFNYPSTGFDTTSSPIAAQLTTAGQGVFLDVNAANPVTITKAWAYVAQPLDSVTIPLLTDSSGNAYAAIRGYSDG